MIRLKYIVLLNVLLLVSASVAAADSYNVSVNTSSITGTSGSLDFQFNPGPSISQAANVQVLDFLSDGTLGGSPILTGDASGALPGTLSFDNATAFNDYFEGFTFGSNLSFEVSLLGPAISSPDGVSESGSAFAFGMFSDPGGTVPALTTDPLGTAFTIAINLDGTTTVTNSSASATIAPVSVVPTPEPSAALLLAVGALSLFGAALARSKRGIPPPIVVREP